MCWYEVPLTNWTEIVYSSHFRMGGTRLVLVHSVQSVSSPRAFISTVHEGINWKAFISTVHEGINWKTDDGIVGMSTRIQMLYSIRSLNKEIIEINEKKKRKKSVWARRVWNTELHVRQRRATGMVDCGEAKGGGKEWNVGLRYSKVLEERLLLEIKGSTRYIYSSIPVTAPCPRRF